MKLPIDSVPVSAVLAAGERLAYSHEDLAACVRSLTGQEPPLAEILIVDDRGPDAALDFLPGDLRNHSLVRHLPGRFNNRAAMYNHALRTARGEFALLIDNLSHAVRLRRSATATMMMAATRSENATMVYGDYESVADDGRRHDVHLLDWHEGRLRDGMDFGCVLLLSRDALHAVGMLDERYHAADLYDLRLRLSEHCRPLHVANRCGGALYSIRAAPAAHDVFAYLLDDKAAQLEMETVLTAHLKRVGAFLPPGANLCQVTYDPADRHRSSDCIASVVIPVHRRPDFIGAAVESVQAQTIRQVEAIVVVNGANDDPTIPAVRRYMPGGDRYDALAPPVRLIVVDVNNIGLCLNLGIESARGMYYVQLDSDDRLKPDAVEKLLRVFDDDPTVGMVIGSYEVWNLDERSGEIHRNPDVPIVTHGEWTEDNGRNNLLRINGAGAPRAAHIKVIREVGGFGVNDAPHCRNYGEDYDLVLRISERYRVGRVWEPIYKVIRHSGGTDHSIDQATIDRNDNAKDHMRLAALRRRQVINRQSMNLAESPCRQTISL